MLTGQLPQSLDPRKLSDQGGEIRGQTTVAELPRLREFRDSLDQPVQVALRFTRDQEGHRIIEGTISTTLTLRCQRCLQPVAYEIEAPVHLAMVWGEDHMKALPERLDPYMVTADKMPVADLVEEEVLLALPLVAMHEECPSSLVEDNAVDATDDGEQEEKENPFAVLAQLKKDGRD